MQHIAVFIVSVLFARCCIPRAHCRKNKNKQTNKQKQNKLEKMICFTANLSVCLQIQMFQKFAISNAPNKHNLKLMQLVLNSSDA